MKYVLITGVGSGIGYDATRYLIENGYFVIGSVRNEADKIRLQNIFTENFAAILFDVTDSNQIQEAVSKVKKVVGDNGLVTLINNAGIAVPGPLNEMKEEELQHQLDINLMGVFRVSNAFLPLLGTDTTNYTHSGKIINISSISGIFNTPFNGAYCISKHALESMSEIYRRELMMYGIDVITIQPGPIKTSIWDKALEIDWKERYKNSAYQSILMNAKTMIEDSKNKALDVENVSIRILKTIESQRPKTQYIIHKNKLIFTLFAKLAPKRFVDKIIKKNLFEGKKIRPI